MGTRKFGEWTFTDEEIKEQIKRSVALGKEQREPSASKFTFDRKQRTIGIHFPDGTSIGFPASKIKELRNVTDNVIEQGRLTPLGDALHWDDLDAHYTIAGFLAGQFGTKAWMQELGRRGGQQTSVAKAEAARENGRKGGRPRKLRASDPELVK